MEDGGSNVVLLVTAAGMTAAGLLFGARRIPRNPLVGFRTPWTMRSDYVWQRTNRAGGYGMAVAGAISMMVAWLWPPLAIQAMLATSLTVALLGTAYSFALARRPDAAARRGLLTAGVRRFVDEECLVGGAARTTTTRLYEEYAAHTHERGETPLDFHDFESQLDDPSLPLLRVGRGDDTRWVGIELRGARRV